MALVLEKEVQKVSKLILEKSGGKKISAQVQCNIDVSGSMRDLFNNGAVQELVEKVLPVAMSVDDNKSLDMWCFDDSFIRLNPVKEGNYNGYVNNSILSPYHNRIWGSTNYSPVLRDNFGQVGGGLFSKSKPTLVYFFTDGEAADQNLTDELLGKWEKSGKPMYVMFIGIGHANFGFLQRMANKYGNVGYTNVQNLKKAVEGDTFYDELTPKEMIDWFSKTS